MLAPVFHRWELSLSRKDRNRTVRPFEWGIEFLQNGISNSGLRTADCGLNDGNPQSEIRNPKSYLIDYARRAVRESDAYHSYAPVKDYRLEGSHLTFSSPLQTANPRNNIVHGHYFPAQSDGRAVLVLPQWNAGGKGHIALARLLSLFGLSTLRLSMPYHDLRMPEELIRADYMLSPNLGRTLQAVRQAVMDCRAALDWLQSEGYSRLGILGTSLGSCIALITMVHDPRLRASVQNHVSPYFADVVWTGISTRHVRAGLEGHVTLEDLREIWMPISPKAYLKRLVETEKKSLLVHARYDHSFLPDLSREVLQEYRDLDLPHSTLELRCGHYTSGKFPFNIILGWAVCHYLRRNL